jgi:hypothetical protein
MTLCEALRAVIWFLAEQMDTQTTQDADATRACIEELRAWEEWVTEDVWLT